MGCCATKRFPFLVHGCRHSFTSYSVTGRLLAANTGKTSLIQPSRSAIGVVITKYSVPFRAHYKRMDGKLRFQFRNGRIREKMEKKEKNDE